jgi:hypothetical protein
VPAGRVFPPYGSREDAAMASEAEAMKTVHSHLPAVDGGWLAP